MTPAAGPVRPLRAVALAALVFWSVCLGLSLLRYHLFFNTMDQGTFNQVFWNGIHGRPFQGSLSSTLSYAVIRRGEPPSASYLRLGQHFTPTQLLWLPAYALHPSAVTLSVLQVTLVTAAGLVLYALARTRLPPGPAALVALAYYAAHAVIGPTLSNFHDISQLPLLLFGVFFALERRWWVLFWLLALLVLGVREDAGMTLVGLGLSLLVTRRHPRLGAALLVASVAYMLAITSLVMPRLSPDISGRFMVERFGGILGGREASTWELVSTLARKPWLLLWELVTPVRPTLEFLLGQWLPVALVPIASAPAWLLSAPVLAGLFVQSDTFSIQLNVRFALTVVPAVFYGTILWWSPRPALAERRLVRHAWIVCMLVSAAFALGSNPHQTVSLAATWPTHLARAAALRSFVARVPADASVAASIQVIPQLSSRRLITRAPRTQIRDDAGEVRSVEYVVADAPGWRACDPARLGPSTAEYGEVGRLHGLLRGGRYGLQDFREGAVLLHRGARTVEPARESWRKFLDRCYPSIAADTSAPRN